MCLRENNRLKFLKIEKRGKNYSRMYYKNEFNLGLNMDRQSPVPLHQSQISRFKPQFCDSTRYILSKGTKKIVRQNALELTIILKIDCARLRMRGVWLRKECGDIQ